MPEDDHPRGSPQQQVMLEDPSEYRPELKDMTIGKDQDEFRIFTKVGSLILSASHVRA